MKEFNNFQEVMDYIKRFTNYEYAHGVDYTKKNYNLNNMHKLLSQVGNPHKRLKTIHIAGTKGKGSTAIAIETILRHAGFKTGLYTSPHLTSLLERINLCGRPVTKDNFVWAVNRIRNLLLDIRPTFFEIMTTCAFLIFEKELVNYAIIEVGLGGRLDSTNIIRPEISIITKIDYDHMDKLGNTLSSIAYEKAGIIKPGIPVISSSQRTTVMQVLEKIAKKRSSQLLGIGREIIIKKIPLYPHRFDLITPLRRVSNLTLNLLGEHQMENVSLAISAILHLEPGINDNIVRTAIKDIVLPARIELISSNPAIILDSAHNPVSVCALKETILGNIKFDRLILIFGVLRDKDIKGILRILLPITDIAIFTKIDNPRACKASELTTIAKKIWKGKVYIAEDVKTAIDKARKIADPRDLILVTGSFYLAGPAIRYLKYAKIRNAKF
jgi:dihydrofolate synthase/folylpolyglutamate synthase